MPVNKYIMGLGVLLCAPLVHPNPAQPVFDRIMGNQFPADCSRSHILLVEADVGQRGIGSRLSLYRMCLGRAVRDGAVYVDLGCDPECNRTLTRPWHGCTAAQLAQARAAGRAHRVADYFGCGREYFEASPLPSVGHLLWATAASQFLLRPNAALEADIAAEYERLGRPNVGLQIRHCDNKMNEAKKYPLAHYLSLVRGAPAGPRPRVLLYTDNHDIYGAVDRDGGRVAGFEFAPQDAAVRHLRVCEWCKDYAGGQPDLSGMPATLSAANRDCFMRFERRAIVDAHLLARCDFLSFTYSSNYGALVLHLQLFRSGFCGSSHPADNYFHAIGSGWLYLQREELVDADKQIVRVTATVVLANGKGADAVDRRFGGRLRSAREAARVARDPAVRRDPWHGAVVQYCGRETRGAADAEDARRLRHAKPVHGVREYAVEYGALAAVAGLFLWFYHAFVRSRL